MRLQQCERERALAAAATTNADAIADAAFHRRTGRFDPAASDRCYFPQQRHRQT